MIPSIVGGLLLVGGGALVGWKLACGARRPPPLLALGEPCGDTAARACGEGLTCAPGARKCLLAGGARCTPARADLCASGKCERAAGVCAVPRGGGACAAERGKPCHCGGTVQCDGACSAPACAGTCTNGRCCVFSADPACGAGPPPARKQDFNSYILRAIELLHQGYRGKGYDINTAYTHDLDYAKPREIKAGPGAPATMCVAAVSEVIITALKLYADERGDRAVFDKLPARSWMNGSPEDIRPYMFLYEGVGSSGTADALKHFGIGEHRPFPALVPGDFIGFGRDNRTGHAVVFLGFLNASGQIEPRYDASKVVGFKYFSAQGKNPPSAGLGYRWAFFGKCPRWREADKPRDCGVIASNDPRLLNTGYMLHPARWNTEQARRALRVQWVQKYSLELLGKRLRRLPSPRDLTLLPRADLRRLEADATRELGKELPPVSRLRFDGATTDD